MEIRAERPCDRDAVWTVEAAAFGRPDEARLAARLRQEASPLVSLVAERAGRVIGHVVFSPVAVENGRTRPPEGALGPVAVLPAEQARGVGSALIRAGIEACRALDWQLLFVLGNPVYYARFGFQLAAPHGLHYESKGLEVRTGAAASSRAARRSRAKRQRAFDVAFQVRELTPGALRGVRGWVRYHPAFVHAS